MPYRKTVFANEEIYHVFNRGVAGLPIYHHTYNYSRFIQLLDYYRFTNTPTSFSRFLKLPLEEKGRILENLKKENNLQVEILAFCLMPNHFHLLLKQISEKGIKSFISNVQNGYAKYFNIKKERSGPLFQSAFKAVRIETDEQLLHVSRYIHLNPATAYIITIEKLIDYHWSSFATYLGINSTDFPFVKPEFILNFFKSPEKYKEFVFNQAEYQRELANIKHLILE
ncbi:transposase [Candidatus Daviesbacteria bacterium]|nr:transposase [Candidatus Daviesbacteria bacterium]